MPILLLALIVCCDWDHVVIHDSTRVSLIRAYMLFITLISMTYVTEVNLETITLSFGTSKGDPSI